MTTKNETSTTDKAMQYEPLLAPVYHSIHTTCKCGKNSELKWMGQWFGNECECGTNIRMNREKSKMIIESTLNTL